MSVNRFYDVEGYDAFLAKIKRLPDSVKRKEVLSVQRRILAPARKAFADNLVKDTGNLSRSVAIKSVSAKRSDGNPSVVVRPAKRGGADGYYKFMVVPKGMVLGSNKRGSRKGKTVVVPLAKKRTIRQMESGLIQDSKVKVSRYMQRKIDKL